LLEELGVLEELGLAGAEADADELAVGEVLAETLGEALGEALGVGLGEADGVGGGGATPGSATPSTRPAGFLKTGSGAGTMPIEAARAASTCGADCTSIFCVRV
jgi:hypothetical protein